MTFRGLKLVSSACLLLLPVIAFCQSPITQAKVIPENKQQVTMSFAPVVRQVAPAVVNIYAKVIRKRRVQPLVELEALLTHILAISLMMGRSRVWSLYKADRVVVFGRR